MFRIDNRSDFSLFSVHIMEKKTYDTIGLLDFKHENVWTLVFVEFECQYAAGKKK